MKHHETCHFSDHKTSKNHPVFPIFSPSLIPNAPFQAAPRGRPWVDSPATPLAPHPGDEGPWRRNPWGQASRQIPRGHPKKSVENQWKSENGVVFSYSRFLWYKHSTILLLYWFDILSLKFIDLPLLRCLGLDDLRLGAVFHGDMPVATWRGWPKLGFSNRNRDLFTNKRVSYRFIHRDLQMLAF